MRDIHHPSGDDHWTRREPERILRGVDAPGAKLSETQLIAMYEEYWQGASKAHLARKYGVDRVTVWRQMKKRET